jgi:AcrR family transcriptional regulator
MSRANRNATARRAGRPPTAADTHVREALLAAARTLFLRFGFRAVSSRQVAAAAGVNPAMIHYYFEGKEGLYRAMLESAIAPVVTRLEAMLGDPKSADLESLARTYMRVLANPGSRPAGPRGLYARWQLPPDVCARFRRSICANAANPRESRDRAGSDAR